MIPPASTKSQRITKDCQPVFPCYLWSARKQRWSMWMQQVSESHIKEWNFTHFHPDQPDAPQEVPEQNRAWGELEDNSQMPHSQQIFPSTALTGAAIPSDPASPAPSKETIARQEHPTEMEYRQKLARHLFRASHRWHREAANLPDTEESFETSWAADGKQRSLFNCMAAWTIREIADWDRKQVIAGIYSTAVGNERYEQLLKAESYLRALDRAGEAKGAEPFKATRTSDGVGSYIMYQPQHLWDDGEFGKSWTNLGEPTVSKLNAQKRAEMFASVHPDTRLRYLEIQSTARVTDFTPPASVDAGTRKEGLPGDTFADIDAALEEAGCQREKDGITYGRAAQIESLTADRDSLAEQLEEAKANLRNSEKGARINAEVNRGLAEDLGKVRSALAEKEKECADLAAWKESALAVEKEWDAQEVGKLLGLPLGGSIRQGIEPGIRALQSALAFYANEANYRRTGWQGDQEPSAVEKDKGALARIALPR